MTAGALTLRLDPVGGVAGDMLVAALIDAFPDREPVLHAALDALALPETVTWRVERTTASGFTGCRFRVETPPGGHHSHHHYTAIRDRIAAAPLAATVRDRALDIYRRLAEAEAAVHGCTVEAVAFHEVGAWDSVVDVVAAAALLDSLDGARWLCGSLPLGGGRVRTDHGIVPVPAPATARLLEGFPVHDDGIPGERVTPTGAAILRHLQPETGGGAAGTLRATGTGLGTKTLPGLLNALRVVALHEAAPAQGWATEHLVRLACDLDDQTPEDVAIAADRLRGTAGVIDVTTAMVQGKKGRLALRLEALADPAALPRVLETCFEQTATLGVRWHEVRRAVLPRRAGTAGDLRIKTAERPGGATVKVEADDLAAHGHSRRDRDRLRAAAEKEPS